MQIIDDIGHHLDTSSCWSVHHLTSTEVSVETESSTVLAEELSCCGCVAPCNSEKVKNTSKTLISLKTYWMPRHCTVIYKTIIYLEYI